MKELSEDRFLGGKLTLHQPLGGFRAGLDAVMLAAAVPDEGEALELGAGVGTASLCLARRSAQARVVGLELDAKLVDIATTNANLNNLSDRVSFVAGDAFDPPAALKREFDAVFCNPPFHGPEGEPSPEQGRAQAKMDGGRLSDWLEAGLRRTRSNGSFTVIFRADRLAEVLAALPDGGVTVLPLWPRAGEPAKRVIVRVRKGARTAMVLLPGLTLHAADGYTSKADAILRGEAALAY